MKFLLFLFMNKYFMYYKYSNYNKYRNKRKLDNIYGKIGRRILHLAD